MNLYRPGSATITEKFFESFTDLLERTTSYKSVIIAGNVNIHLDNHVDLHTIKFETNFFSFWTRTARQVIYAPLWSYTGRAPHSIRRSIRVSSGRSTDVRSLSPRGESTVVSIVSCRRTYCCPEPVHGKKIWQYSLFLSWHCAMCKSVNCHTMSWASV